MIVFDSPLIIALFTDNVFKFPGIESLFWNISDPYSFKYVHDLFNQKGGSYVSTDFCTNWHSLKELILVLLTRPTTIGHIVIN